MSAWREFWAEAGQPSGYLETAYQWAVIQCGHVVVGMAATVSLSWLTARPEASVLIAPVYFVLKELRDLHKGGTMADSLVDTAFVCLGIALAVAPQLAPLAIAALALGITLRRPQAASPSTGES